MVSATSASKATVLAFLFFALSFAFQATEFRGAYAGPQHDLRAYLACSHNILAHRPIYTTHHQAIPEDPTLTSDVPKYLYPPLLGIAFIPATVFSFSIFRHIWFFINFFFVLHSIWLAVSMLPFRKNRLAAFFMSAAAVLTSDSIWWLLYSAQVDAFVVYLSVLSMHSFKNQRWMASAVLIAIASWLKLTPGIFLLYMLTRGNRRFILSALISGTGLGMLQLAMMPGDFFLFFTQILPEGMPSPFSIPTMQSLWSLCNMILVPSQKVSIFNAPQLFPPILMFLKILVSIYVLCILLRRWESAVGMFFAFSVCSSFSLLITDVSWIMRFTGNLISTCALMYLISIIRNTWATRILVPLATIFILINIKFVETLIFPPGQAGAVIMSAGPSVHALGSLLLIGTVWMKKSRWIGPILTFLKLFETIPCKRQAAQIVQTHSGSTLSTTQKPQ